MVEFTDPLQSVLEFLVVAQPLLIHGFLFGAETELFGAATWITDGQYPNRVALSAGASGTAGAMADVAVEQRTAKDFGGGGQCGGQLCAPSDDRFLIHLYK